MRKSWLLFLETLAWPWRLRRREKKELKRFEERLVGLLNRGGVSFPIDEGLERFFEAQEKKEEVQRVVERCLISLKEKGVIKSV